MNKSTIIKAFLFSMVCAFCINTASAQKTDKKTEKAKQTSQPSDETVKSPEPATKWIYSVATVTNEGDNFTMVFERSENKSTDENLERAKARSQEMSFKMQEVAKKIRTETDLINTLAEQNLELISVVNHPGKEGKVMKYYFRMKVQY